MLKKVNNKKLIAIFSVLIIVFLFVKFFYSPKSENNFLSDFQAIDTSLVASVVVKPEAEKGKEIVFKKNSGMWTVSKENISAEAQSSSVQNILSELANLKPQRLAARSKEKWEEYKVTDTSGTRVIVKNKKGEELLDIVVGKFTFQQQNGLMGYGRNNVSGISYIRFSGDDKVYAINGFLPMSLNMEFNNFRKQDFIQFNKDDVTRLIFKYPSDSGFVLSKRDSVWNLNNSVADKEFVEQYLAAVSSKKQSRFVDDFTPAIAADFELVIEGNNMTPLTISAYKRSETEWVLQSSLNTKSYFLSKNEEVFSEIFKNIGYFLNRQ